MKEIYNTLMEIINDPEFHIDHKLKAVQMYKEFWEEGLFDDFLPEEEKLSTYNEKMFVVA